MKSQEGYSKKSVEIGVELLSLGLGTTFGFLMGPGDYEPARGLAERIASDDGVKFTIWGLGTALINHAEAVSSDRKRDYKKELASYAFGYFIGYNMRDAVTRLF